MPLVDQDQEHLKILSIAWYVMAGFIAFFSMFGLVYAVLGSYLTINPPPSRNGEDAFIGPLFAFIGISFTVACFAMAYSTFLAGRFLSRRLHRTFCFVMACIHCLQVPFGVALGVFTILVIQRPTVRSMFEAAKNPPPLPETPS